MKHSGELPGQYFLEYYTDRTCRKLKGKIDLDQCEQVDSGLTIESRKQRYAHMFDIRTPKRVYFLAADSESDMNGWVGCICHVCGLKGGSCVISEVKDGTGFLTFSFGPAVFYKEEEEGGSALTLTRNVTSPSANTVASSANNTLTRQVQSSHLLLLGEDTPPTSPISPTGSSGPYFPLSECLSGSRSLFFNEVMSSTNQPSSAPVTPAPTARGIGGTGGGAGGALSGAGTLGTQSLRGKPRRENWDLFYDQPRPLGQSQQQLTTASGRNRAGPEGLADAITGFEEKFSRSFKRLMPAGQQQPKPPLAAGAEGQKFVPPPRPPKPPHLSDQPSHNYLNLDQLQSGVRTHSRSSSPRSPPASASPSMPTASNPDAW